MDLSARITARVKQDFGDSAVEVLRLIEGWTIDYPRSEPDERLVADAVLTARGDFRRFAQAIETSKLDWRDLVVGSGVENSDWREVFDEELGVA